MIEHLIKLCWFLVAICILVPIHEFGHFYAMRIFGVKVLRFSVGFGKRLFTWSDAHGTEFALSAIPLGGYVKPLDERNGDVEEKDMPFTLGAKKEWQRIIIFLAGPVANLVLAVLFYAVLMFFKGTSSYTPVIGDVEPGSIAAQAGLESGQEIIAIDGEETPTRRAVAMHMLTRLGDTGDIHFTVRYPESDFKYESQSQLDGWLKGVESPDPIKGLGLGFYYPPIPKVLDQVLEDSAAEKAGLLAGDELVSMDGNKISAWREWVDYVRARPSEEISVVIRRGDRLENIVLVPDELTEKGKSFGRAGVSVQLPEFPEHMIRNDEYGLVSAFFAGVQEAWETSAFVLLSIKKLIFGEISAKNLSGPIGIAKVAASHAELGFWAFVSFLAHLSIVLGVMNLLPIPVLDGGHIVFCIVEWVKGSPVSQEVQVWSLNVGIVMLIGVMIIASYNDIALRL